MAELQFDDWVALVSGVPLAVLGVLLLRIRPRRRDQVFFAAFALLWAVQVTGAYVGTATRDSTIHAKGTMISYGVAPLLGLLLVHFSNLVRPARALRRVAIIWAVLTVANAVLIVLRPEWFVRVEGGTGSPAIRLGPLSGVLSAPLFYLAFFVAITIVWRSARTAPPGAPSDRARWMVIALGLFASYASVRTLLVVVRFPENQSVESAFAQIGLIALFCICTLAAGTFAIFALISPPLRNGRDWWLFAAFAGPAAFAILENSFRARDLDLYSYGVWRCATVGVVGYAIAKYRLFDVDLKLKRGVKATTIGAAFIAIFFVVSESAAAFFAGSIGTYLGIAAAGLLVFALAPLQRVAERVASVAMPQATGAPEYLAWRKMQVYHAALDGAMQDGEVTTKERAILARLRQELGIRDEDAAALEADLARRFEHPMPA